MCQINSVVIFLVCVLSAGAIKFKVTREWKYLNFTWPDDGAYKTAVSKGSYIPENNIISGITHFEDFFYVTLPRMKNGVPATLARIPWGIVQDTAPALEPFPSWEMNSVDDCNALQNVQSVQVDPKGQAWIIDCGRTETLSPSPTNRCPPKLVIFDIRKNMTTLSYTFPEHIASANSSFLYDLVVDNTDGGYAYITDNSRKDPGIIVFSLRDQRSWKLRHSKTMRADPTATTFRVNNTIISDPINIASIALGPKIHTSNDRITVNEDREVFFCPLSSLHLYSVNTTVLRNEMNSINDGEYQGELKDYGLKSSQSIGMVMDNQGVLYYSLLATYSIARWDSHTSFQSGQKIIARDENYLEWPNSFTFDQNGNITVLVNKLNKFIYDNLNLNEVNFRLISANVGAKSYLYDQDYDYTVDQSSSSSTTTTTEKLPQPNLPSAIDQDPYLGPVPEPRPKPQPLPEPLPVPEPTAEPETTAKSSGEHMDRDYMNHSQTDKDQMDHMDHDHMDHDHMDHDHMDHDMDHDRMDHDQMDHDHIDNDIMNHNETENFIAAPINATAVEESKSGAERLVATFMGVLFAGALFII